MLRWVRLVRPQDVVLLVLFAALTATRPSLDASEIALFLALAALHVAEPRIPFLGTRRGKVLWIVLQLFSGIGSIATTSSTAETGGVAYAAHVGGFISGLVLTLLLRGRNSPQGG